MLKTILPQPIIELLEKNFKLNGIYEIRMRTNKPLVINYFGKFVLVKNDCGSNFIVEKPCLEAVINSATKNSLYAFMPQLKQAFITSEGGIRIGVCGEVVLGEDGKIQTVKNFCSLNIRIPHQIKNCAHTALCYILNGGINSTLILAPPGAGKTTFLKDICANLSTENRLYQVLICDERFELASSYLGIINNDIGICSDVVSGSSKNFAFSFAIRTMKPDVIVCDEIMSQQDAESVVYAIKSGAKVIATAHAKNIADALMRKELKYLLDSKVFNRIIVLSSRNGPGTYEGIYNENLISIYKTGEL